MLVGVRHEGVSELSGDRVREFLARDYSKVVGIVAMVCRDRAAAEDAVQEALVTTWNCGDSPDSYLAWVTAVAHNKARSATRKLRAEQRALERVPPAVASQDETVRADVARALARLSLRQRQVTVLRYWLDLDVAGIAQVLEVSESTVKTQLSRARKALAPILQEEADHV